MPLDLVQTLSDLISIPSVNPMGRPYSGEEFLEYRVTEYLEKLFTGLGLPWTRQQVQPKRDNIIARLDGEIPAEKGGPILMFEAHQDTVPVDGMTIEPWKPVIDQGKIYGRGSCDIKGGMTAMLWAFARLAQERPKGMPTLVMACSVNEEHGFSGAAALKKMWEGPKSFLPRPPDAAVVAEPTELQVVIAHKGAVRWRCNALGRAAHSSQPHLGENAFYKMARILLALEDYALKVAPSFPQHPLCGPATLSVGTIQGGISVNTVPDRCTIEIDRRLLPGENPETVYQQVLQYVANHPAVTFPVDHEKPYLVGPALGDEANRKVAEPLGTIAKKLFGRGDLIGVPYGTDASKISQDGVPSVVFGPGSIAQAHTCDEWLSLDELEKGAEVLYQFGKRGLA